MKIHLATSTTHKILLLFVLATLAVAAVRPASAAASGRIQAKVWVVSVAQASNVTFPAPLATPDMTFSTNGVTYIGGWYSGQLPAAHCFTISKFVGGCETRAFKPKYSGLYNSYLGSPVNATTAMGGNNYGVIMQFTGSLNLSNGDTITILHDDGVSLLIDGAPVSGFSSGVLWPVLESVTFTGATGSHSFTLLYGNVGVVGDGAWLLFFQALF